MTRNSNSYSYHDEESLDDNTRVTEIPRRKLRNNVPTISLQRTSEMMDRTDGAIYPSV